VWVALGTVGLVFPPTAARAQISPEESARWMKPAPGLEATLWASEPMLINPTNIDVDSRGRVWVAEGLNYRLTRGDNRRFPRVADADRIKILEDTDGDGKADKVTVFAAKISPCPWASRSRSGTARMASTRAAAPSSATALTCSSSRTPTATTRPTGAT